MTTFVDHKKARFNYEIIEKFDAGIELAGHEVKALKSGKGSLDGAHVLIRGGEAYLVGAMISPYQENNTPPGYEARRNRRLLLTKEEITKLADLEGQNGLTIVPLSIYNKGNLVKVSIAVVRGKKKYDKRATIQKRETDRIVRREFKDR